MPTVTDYTPEQIKTLRERYRISQAVLASMLNAQHQPVYGPKMGDRREAPWRPVPEVAEYSGSQRP